MPTSSFWADLAASESILVKWRNSYIEILAFILQFSFFKFVWRKLHFIKIALLRVKHKQSWHSFHDPHPTTQNACLPTVVLIPFPLTEYNQQDSTFLNLFISVRRFTCFRRVFRPSSGAQNCTYSVRYLWEQHLTLYVQFWATDDGRKTGLKHVERLTEINKLRNVASYWLYSANILAMHGPMNVKPLPLLALKLSCVWRRIFHEGVTGRVSVW